MLLSDLFKRAYRSLRRQPQPGRSAPHSDHGARNGASSPKSESDALTEILAAAKQLQKAAKKSTDGKETARLTVQSRALRETVRRLRPPRKPLAARREKLTAA